MGCCISRTSLPVQHELNEQDQIDADKLLERYKDILVEFRYSKSQKLFPV
jgi:hypothetical protein